MKNFILFFSSLVFADDLTICAETGAETRYGNIYFSNENEPYIGKTFVNMRMD